MWIIGGVGNIYFGAFEININQLTGNKYDPDNIEQFVTHWYNDRYTEKRAIRLVDSLKNKIPVIGTSEPWGSSFVPQRRKQIDSFRMESY